MLVSSLRYTVDLEKPENPVVPAVEGDECLGRPPVIDALLEKLRIAKGENADCGAMVARIGSVNDHRGTFYYRV